MIIIRDEISVMQSMLGQQFTLLDYIYNLESDERVSDADSDTAV